MTPEEKANRTKQITQVLLFTVLGCTVGPFAALAIPGMIAIGVCGVIGAATIAFAPMIGMKLGNYRLKLLKAEAMKNPIETLQLDYLAKQKKLEENLQSIEKLRTATLTWEDKVEKFRRIYPNDVGRFETQLNNMRALVLEHEQAYSAAAEQLTNYGHEIERASAMWDMTIAANSAAETAQLTIDDFTQRIKSDTALEAVQLRMNDSFSQLNTIRLRNRESREIQQPQLN